MLFCFSRNCTDVATLIFLVVISLLKFAPMLLVVIFLLVDKLYASKFVPMLLVEIFLLVDKLYASKFVPMLLVVISLLVDKLYASKFVPMLLVVISLLVDKNLFVFFWQKQQDTDNGKTTSYRNYRR